MKSKSLVKHEKLSPVFTQPVSSRAGTNQVHPDHPCTCVRLCVCVCVCVCVHVCLGVWDGLKCVLNSLRAHVWMSHLPQGVGMSECDLVCDRGLRGTSGCPLG